MSEPSRDDIAKIVESKMLQVPSTGTHAYHQSRTKELALEAADAILALRAAKPERERVIEEMSAVVNEMIEVATDDDDSVMAEWTSDNRAEIDKWQVRLQIAIRALKGTPA